MAIISKDKSCNANIGPLVKIFDSPEEYNTWKAALATPADEEKHIVIKRYEPIVVDEIKAKAAVLTLDGKQFALFHEADPKYFTITSDTPMTVEVKFTTPGGMIGCSVDGRTWSTYTSSFTTPSSRVLKFFGEMPTKSLFVTGGGENEWKINNGTNVVLSGDITTLLTFKGNLDEVGDYAFSNMFSSLNCITKANIKFPRKMGDYAAFFCFGFCPNLTVAPTISTTEMGIHCFDSTFYDCPSLIEMPDLPARILSKNCYQSMFYSCTKITKIKPLPADTLEPYCYYNMFADCTSLTGEIFLPATTLAEMCYNSMFKNCTSLIVEPGGILSYTDAFLPQYCYDNMFSGCTSLNRIWGADFGTSDCASYMFRDIPDLFSTTKGGVYVNSLTSSFAQSGFSSLGDLQGTIYGKYI